MAEEAPPLRTWLLPSLVASVMVVSFLYYCYSSNGPYAEVIALSNKNLENALIENTRDTSAISIVLLGSSLTEYALVDPHALEDSISQLTNKKTHVLRVALNYMDNKVAKRIDFFDYVSKYPIDYLFIEDLSFNLNHSDTVSGMPDQINTALLQVRNLIRSAIGVQAHDNYYNRWYTFDIKPQPNEPFYTLEFDSMTFKSLQKSKGCSVRKVSQNSVANNAYDALTKRNAKVVFLEMPVSKHFPRNFLNQQRAADHEKNLQLYKEQYNVDYWPFPYQVDDSCFVDGAHLNYNGAMQYQKWFVSKIASKN
jgi:hypothetical protein